MSLVKNCRMSVRLAEKVFLYDMDTMYARIHGYHIYTYAWIPYISFPSVTNPHSTGWFNLSNYTRHVESRECKVG